jgi:hypothetical protein
VDDVLNEEQYYRILDTQGDVAYAQPIDPTIALLSFDGHTIQQVLSSGASAPAAVSHSATVPPTTVHQHQSLHPIAAAHPSQAQLLSSSDVIAVSTESGVIDRLKF